MYYPTICALMQSVEHHPTKFYPSIINKKYHVDYDGVIGLYVWNSQLSIFIETKDVIKGYKIKSDNDKAGQWYTITLERNKENELRFNLLRELSEHYIEVIEQPITLELFKEMLNQETQVGFSNVKDINATLQLALAILSTNIDFKYEPISIASYISFS